MLSEPSSDFMEYIAKLAPDGAKFWSEMIVSQQRDVVISAAAMAVGINMTFLFPYSMLKKAGTKTSANSRYSTSPRGSSFRFY